MAAHFDCVPYSMAAWLGGGATTVDVAPCMSISWAEIICNKKYNFLLQIISSAVRSKDYLIAARLSCGARWLRPCGELMI